VTTTDLLDRALDVLASDDLEPIVEMVLCRRDGAYEAVAVDGRVRFRRDRDGFAVEAVEGRNPLGDQAADRFTPLAVERAERHPPRHRNAYPFAYEMVAQLFDHPAAPDLCVIHTAAHNWEDAGGHRGEHGSLDAVQARAPFIAAGAGVRRLGVVPRACRLVDVGPTICALLGDDVRLRSADGAVIDGILDGCARHVVVFLLDGCNANVLYDLAARGTAPNVARLVEAGTAFAHGAIASLPSVTLANHTTVLTGAHPGHHGILHNAWWDRASGRQVVTNSPDTWPAAVRWLSPAVDTVHEALHRARPDAFSASVNEPCDRGADYSTFDLIRRGQAIAPPPPAERVPFATERFVRPVKDYAWGTRVDHAGITQAVAVWREHRPTFLWCNFTLTDAAFHAGGPHSEIAEASVADTDARIGVVLDAVAASGAWDDTAFVLVADHGMEETNPEVTGDWGPALAAAGIPFRDEAFGFLYLAPPPNSRQ
jgi:phosphonoacetate hydrolase